MKLWRVIWAWTLKMNERGMDDVRITRQPHEYIVWGQGIEIVRDPQTGEVLVLLSSHLAEDLIAYAAGELKHPDWWFRLALEFHPPAP